MFLERAKFRAESRINNLMQIDSKFNFFSYVSLMNTNRVRQRDAEWSGGFNEYNDWNGARETE